MEADASTVSTTATTPTTTTPTPVTRPDQVTGGCLRPHYGTILLDSEYAPGKFRAIRLLHAVLLPSCPVKLLACSPFVRGGSKVTLKKIDQLEVTSAEGDVLLRGKESCGLYGLHSKTKKSAPTTPSLLFLLECKDGSIAMAEKLLLLLQE